MKICSKCNNSYGDSAQFCPVDSTPLAAATAPVDPIVTRELAGRFLVVEKLGQGGMGAVYRALHTKMDRTCAIKILSPAAADSQSAIARFKREAKMASRIDNPHAVTIYDFGEAEGGMLYLAMECIEGKSLSQVLSEQRRLGTERTVHITNQIAEALSAAHTLGIVHRDLKPDNVMLTHKGGDPDYVKVLDFGIAKTVAEDGADDLTRTGFILGTPVYMSPEQLSGEQLDSRSDVYSLAIMAYEMISGKLPFEGDNPQAIMIKRLTHDPIALRVVAPTVNEAIEQAVMAGLARNRDSRTPTVEQFASELTAAAYSGTHAMGGRPTDQMTGRPARPTNVIPDRRTFDGTITGAPTTEAADSAATPRISGTSPSTHATVPTPPAPIPPDEYKPRPPSSYVTQRSRESVSPVFIPGAQGQPVDLDPTTALDQPASPHVSHPLVESVPQLPAPGGKSKTLILVSLILVLFFASVGAAGYFLYSRLSGAEAEDSAPAQPVGIAAVDSAAATANHQAAARHYNQGKDHQEQAYMLAKASPSSASEENQKAAAEYRRALELRSNYPEARENLGVALYNLGDLNSALEQYRTAIGQYTAENKRPTAQVLTNYGLALFDLKRYGEAAEAFGRALEIEPEDLDLYAHQGFALDNAGEKTRARAIYNRYLDRAPTGQYADSIKQILAGRAVAPSDAGNR